MTEKLQSYSEEISGLPLFIAAAEEGGNDSVLGNNDSLDEYYEDSYSDGDESDDTSDFSSYVHSGAPSMSKSDVRTTVPMLMRQAKPSER